MTLILPNVTPIRRLFGLRWYSARFPYHKAARIALPYASFAALVTGTTHIDDLNEALAGLSVKKEVAEIHAEASSAMLAHCLNGGAFRVGRGAIKCFQPLSEGVK